MSDRKKIRFIINPFSGASSKDNFEDLLKKYLDHEKFEYDYCLTQSEGHATILSQESVDLGHYMVVAVGGDGTVNEVAASLINTKTCLGVIPAGSGNGFAMFIGMGRNQKKAIEILNNSETVIIDSCKMNDTFFINIAGVGFDADIAYHIKRSSQRGFSLYFKTVIKRAFKFKAHRYKLSLDDKSIDGEYTIIAIANAAMYGYNFVIAPEAELTDGLFDVVFIKKASLFRYLLSSWRMINNSLHKSRLVDIKKASSVSITTEGKDYCHLDGEGFISPERMNFKMIPKSVKLMIPKSNLLK